MGHIRALIIASSGSRTWSDIQLRKTDSIILSMSRRMHPQRRESEEHMWDWRIRMAATARQTMMEYGLNTWRQIIQTHMWGWTGHVARRENNDFTKTVALWNPTKMRRNPGRPRASWIWNKPMENHLGTSGGRWGTAAAHRDVCKNRGAIWVETEYEGT